MAAPISFKITGSTKRTQTFLQRMQTNNIYLGLERLAQQGVTALEQATPKASGETAAAWSYRITYHGSSVSIEWTNSNIVDGVPVVILLQYGHGTGTGGYVQGRDFINPAIKPIFDQIANDVWKKVTTS